jgi:head-tail adaptor
MLAAGLLTKTVYLYMKYIEKNSIGEENESLLLVKTLKAEIKGFDSKSVINTNNEIVSLDKLVIKTRKIKIDNPLKFQIKYQDINYKIVGINQEYRDDTVLVCEQINE